MKYSPGCYVDFADSVVSSGANVFSYNVEAALKQAATIHIQNYATSGSSSVTYTAIPAWFDQTNKRLYCSAVSGHYWAVDGTSLKYT